VRAFETELYKYIDARHPSLFKDIVTKKILDDQTKGALDAAVKQFAADFAAKKSAAA
jgi:F-type H+-transporting ATPase subunit alpha